MSNEGEEFVSEPNINTQGVRIEPTFDPLFLETGVPLVPFQESRGVPTKEVLRESAQSPKPFDAHTLRSKLSSYDLKLLWERCEIPPIIKLRLIDEVESANMTTIDKIGVYWDMFINGFRVPLHPFFVKVLNAYGLSPGQLSPHAWRFMSFFIHQYFDDEEEEEESENDPGDPPLFNAQGVLVEIILHELASVHGIEVEEEEMQDLDFGELISGSQPKIGGEKLITTDKVLDEEKNKVMIENNFCREAEKKVGELSKKVERLELSNSGLTSQNTELVARVSQLEVEKSTVAHQAVQLFKKSKAFTDQRYRDSKRTLVHGYHECKNDILKDHPNFDLSIYEHKFAREIAAEDILRAEEAERKRAASSRALTSPSISYSLGASGSASGAVSRQQSSIVEGQTHELGMPESAAEQQNEYGLS
ncbi:hypothetical protein RJ639_006537 [Escallonia herrerae]|uniref:Transposase (putative) gypsy type domain-containing protein n=1 Tax=Escallonia herrerae TaxID=1293975 RepID=A0AA89AZH7_9ASTE|nr:hypothetical protein RJ639_006537 [Escallonia herrerae]